MPARPPFTWHPGEIAEARAMLVAGKSRAEVCAWFGCTSATLSRALGERRVG